MDWVCSTPYQVMTVMQFYCLSRKEELGELRATLPFCCYFQVSLWTERYSLVWTHDFREHVIFVTLRLRCNTWNILRNILQMWAWYALVCLFSWNLKVTTSKIVALKPSMILLSWCHYHNASEKWRYWLGSGLVFRHVQDSTFNTTTS